MGALRVMLAIAVLSGHAGGFLGLPMLNGDTAVQGFYVVSGFYMTLVLSEKYGTDRVSRRRFWLNRYLRLAPAYLLISAAAAIERLARSGQIWPVAPVDALAAAIALASNLLLVGQDLFMFFAFDTASARFVFMPDILRGGIAAAGPGYAVGWSLLLIPQGWSIGVEVWFYLLAPFVVTRRLRVVAAVMAASLAVRVGLANVLGWKFDPWTYRFFPSELFTFLAGCLAYRAYARWRDAPFLAGCAPAAAAVLLPVILLYPWIPGGGAEKRWVFVGLVALSLPVLFARTRDWAADRWIGELSYPIYLSHLLVLNFLTGLPDRWRGLACLAATIAVSAAIMVLVERPIDRLRQVLATRSEVPQRE